MQLDSAIEHMMQLAPQERVATVRPFWVSLTEQLRLEFLTIDVEVLRDTAKHIAETAREQTGTLQLRRLPIDGIDGRPRLALVSSPALAG